MKKLLFIVLLFLTIIPSIAQQNRLKELLYAGNFSELIRLVQTDIPSATIRGDTACMAGQAYESLSKYREAYKYYKIWLSADTLNVAALNAVARTALQLGKAAEAENYYLRVYNLDSTNFNANLPLAKLYFQQKQYVRSLKFYTLLLESDSTNSSFLSGAGDCFANMGLLPNAFNFYTEAFRLNKENASLAIVLINTMLNMHEIDPGWFLNSAMAVCDTAICYSPHHPALIQSKGVLYYLMKDYPAADSLLSELVVAGDSSFINLRYVALAKVRQGHYIESVPYLEKLYLLDTTNKESVMLLATSLGYMGGKARALAMLDKLEKLQNPTEEERYNLAFQRATVYSMVDAKKAQQYYWEAYKLSKKNKKSILAWFAQYYSFTQDTFEKESEEDYAKGLFFHVQYLRAVRAEKEPAKKAAQTERSQYVLELFLTDMGFKDQSRLPMLSPDGVKEWITRDALLDLARDK